jgi:hypothetical protein
VTLVAKKNSDFVIKDGVLKSYRGQSKHVVIPEGVTSIGEYCFDESDIVTVKFPKSLTGIESGAFARCNGIRTITLPNTLKKLGYYVFTECENLVSVDVPDSLSDIPMSCFRECTNLTKVNLPSKLKTIDYKSFYKCSSLTQINIPDTVTKIGSMAFGYCINLRRVNMPDIVIDEDVFEGCEKLNKNDFRYEDMPKFHLAPAEEIEDDEYDNIDDWYMSEKGDSDNYSFSDKLESLVRTEFDVSDYFEEPSIQGFAGNDYVDIGLGDGSKYSFAFSWSEMQENIFENGPDKAAKHYFNEIKEGIESGSASTDTTTL